MKIKVKFTCNIGQSGGVEEVDTIEVPDDWNTWSEMDKEVHLLDVRDLFVDNILDAALWEIGPDDPEWDAGWEEEG